MADSVINLQDGNQPIDAGISNKNNYTSDGESAYTRLKERYGEVDSFFYFNPYRVKEDIEPFMGGLPIIFITTPSMNIFKDGEIDKNLQSANSIFALYNNTDRELMKNLQYGFGGSKSVMIKFLTNRFKGLSLKDFSMRTQEEFETFYGWKQVLPGPNIDSFTADSSFVVNFSETKNLDVTKFHYAWMQYIEAVRYGLHSPTSDMRVRRTIDYTSSLYFFLLDFDMSKILYYSKYTGLYPTNVPLGSLVTGDINSKGPVDTSINYAYQYKEELNPQIIFDFNAVFNNPSKLYGFTRKDSEETMTYQSASNDYNYSNIRSMKRDSKMSPISFNINDLKFNKVEIKTFSNNNYDGRNETGFRSSTNKSRTSFHMVFSNQSESILTTPNYNSNDELDAYGLKPGEVNTNINKPMTPELMDSLRMGRLNSVVEKYPNKSYDDLVKMGKLSTSDATYLKAKDRLSKEAAEGKMTSEELASKLSDLKESYNAVQDNRSDLEKLKAFNSEYNVPTNDTETKDEEEENNSEE